MNKIRSDGKAACWFLYMVVCADDSLYTGISTDLHRRVAEHNHGLAGARYTRGRRPVRLVYWERLESRAAAARREWVVKRLSRRAKWALVAGEAGFVAPL